MLQDFTHLSPAGPDALSLSADHRYILEQAPSTQVSIAVPLSKLLDLNRPDNQHFVLEQAALALGVPVSTLWELSNRQRQFNKRPRLDTGIQMSSQYTDDPSTQDGQEKPLANQLDAGACRKSQGLFAQGGLSSGWTGARLADCFAGFSMCPPCSPFDSQPGMSRIPAAEPFRTSPRNILTGSEAYQPLAASPYSCDDQKPPPAALETAVVSMQPQAQPPLIPTTVTPDPTPLFPCDDSLIAQYLSSYPPLQPSRVAGSQPAPTREEMVYPGASPTGKYDGSEGDSHVPSDLRIQGQPSLENSPLQTGAVQGPYAVGGEPPPFDGHAGFMGLNARFHPAQRLDVKPNVGSFAGQDDRVADFYPHHKTTPVKRGPFRDQDQREKTALTRKMGSCIRCRMQRIRVSSHSLMRIPCLSRPVLT